MPCSRMLGIRLAFVRPPPSSLRIARFRPADSTGISFRTHAEFAAFPVPDFHPGADDLRPPTLVLRVPKAPVRRDVGMDYMLLVFAAMLARVRFLVGRRVVASFA